MTERIKAAQERLKEIQAKIKDISETVQIAGLVKKDEIDAKLAEARSNAIAAHETARIVRERGKGKLNSELIKAQMTMEAAKDALDQKVENLDKEHRKARIDDLLTYSENCEAMALSLIAESKLALLQAAEEALDYAEKYGEDA